MSLIQIRCELEKVLSVYCKYVYDLLKLGASDRMWWCTSAKFANIHILHIHGHVQQIEFFFCIKQEKCFKLVIKQLLPKFPQVKIPKRFLGFQEVVFLLKQLRIFQ